jgi:hypothetical protein
MSEPSGEPAELRLFLCVPESNVWCDVDTAYRLEEPYFIFGEPPPTDFFGPPKPEPPPCDPAAFLEGLDLGPDVEVGVVSDAEHLEMLGGQVRAATCLAIAPAGTTHMVFRGAIARMPAQYRPTRRRQERDPWD